MSLPLKDIDRNEKQSACHTIVGMPLPPADGLPPLDASGVVTSDATTLGVLSLQKIPCGPHVVAARRRRHRRIRAALARPGIPRFVGNGWGGRRQHHTVCERGGLTVLL